MADDTTMFAFRAYGVSLGLRTNDPTWLPRAAEVSYPPTWQPIATTSKIDRLYTLNITPSKFTLYEGTETTITSRSRRAVLEDLERRMKIYVAEMAPRRVFVHAGVVGWQGRAILLPGSSYAGKTSLVAALVKAGATYYSDEYAVLDLRGRVHAYPQPLAMRKPGGSARQYNTPASHFGGVVGTKPLPVGAVIVSQYQAGARWRPQPLTAGQAILALLEHTVPARRKPAVVLPTLSRVSAEAIAWRVKRSEAADAATHLLQLVANHTLK
jgi:hypothetical protein